MAKVGLVFGGRSVEHAVSLRSARTVAAALAEAGHEVLALGIAEDGCFVGEEASRRALAGEADVLAALGQAVAPSLVHLVESGAEVLFPIVHGTSGEDGALQGLAEMFDLAYVGCGVAASAVAMDKVLTKAALERVGLPVVPYRSFDRQRFEAEPAACVAVAADLPLPLFVKPALGVSSVCVRKVNTAAEIAGALAFALRFGDNVVVEQGIAGRELECAVLGHHAPAASAVGEIVPGRDFYDYVDKYLTDGARLIAPAELPADLADRLRELAVRAFRAIGGSGLARVDFFLDGQSRLYVNEINTLPGFTSISMYPRLWALAGVGLPALVDRLVGHAIERHHERARLDVGIRDWLREVGAGSLA